jgi:hypothetical protein
MSHVFNMMEILSKNVAHIIKNYPYPPLCISELTYLSRGLKVPIWVLLNLALPPILVPVTKLVKIR